MANAFVGTTELLQIGDGNIADISVSDVLEGAPLIRALISGTASHDTSHEWLKKTAAPNTGFRAVNDGRENKKATYSKITEALKLYDASFDVDEGLLRSQNGERLFRREALDHLQATFANMEKQVIYGTSNDAGGFAGLADESTVDALADPMVVDAGGTTDNTASSVWAIRNAENGIAPIFGSNGQIELMERRKVLRDGSATGVYDAERQPILFWACLQIASAYDVGRIVNLTEDSGKDLTDDLLGQLYGVFPAEFMPTHFVMSKRSLMQLQRSRTTYSPTGAEAPIPTNWNGIPIVVTSQISDTEALVS